MAGYSKRSLGDKLGLKAEMKVYFHGLPLEVEKELADKIKNAAFVSKSLQGSFDFIHFFTKEAKELSEAFPKLTHHLAEKGMIWISWPKKTSKVLTDLDENIIREMGLKLGIVDVKVCAVSAIWSGLKFYRRKKMI